MADSALEWLWSAFAATLQLLQVRRGQDSHGGQKKNLNDSNGMQYYCTALAWLFCCESWTCLCASYSASVVSQYTDHDITVERGWSNCILKYIKWTSSRYYYRPVVSTPRARFFYSYLYAYVLNRVKQHYTADTNSNSYYMFLSMPVLLLRGYVMQQTLSCWAESAL